jgi:hypothetical protein
MFELTRPGSIELDGEFLGVSRIMATRATQITAPAFEAVQHPKDAVLRAAGAPEERDAGRLGNLARRVWATSFQLGLAGPSGLAYQGSRALSAKDKAVFHALTMGYIQ